MDLETSSPACPCCSPPSTTRRRSVKRKLDQTEGEAPGDPPAAGDVARVELANEVAALREALARHQQSIQELCVELEEERNASSTAASEAMSMILRLQREKAEVQMEARQFKRFAEEKMAHDQRELAALDDLLYKREQVLQSLACELQACKHRLLSYGIAPEDDDYPQTPDAAAATVFVDSPRADDLPLDGYPRLRCDIPGYGNDYEATDLDKYAFGEAPPNEEEELKNLEHRICQLETTPSGSHVMEKGVVGQSPSRPSHFRQSSVDNCGSGLFSVRDGGQEFRNQDEFPVTVDRPLDDNGGNDDDSSDRVYTIDAIHGIPTVKVCEDSADTVSEKRKREVDGGEEEGATDIKKLYMRLQALEADRESMRQAIISMRTEKAQLVLLKEIAQQFCKEAVPKKRVVKKKPSVIRFSFISVVKWIMSFVFWRKKATQSKFTFGHSNNNAGLLLLLDRSPRMSQWRFLPTRRDDCDC